MGTVREGSWRWTALSAPLILRHPGAVGFLGSSHFSFVCFYVSSVPEPHLFGVRSGDGEKSNPVNGSVKQLCIESVSVLDPT